MKKILILILLLLPIILAAQHRPTSGNASTLLGLDTGDFVRTIPELKILSEGVANDLLKFNGDGTMSPVAPPLQTLKFNSISDLLLISSVDTGHISLGHDHPEILSEVSETLLPLSGYLNSMSEEQQNLTLLVSGTSVYLDVVGAEGGDMHIWLNDTLRILDCTTGSGVDGKARIEIAQGTAILDKWSCVYAYWDNRTNKVELANSEQLPIGVYSNIAYLSIQDYATVSATGSIVFQRTTEAISHNGQGSVSRMRENTRLVKGGGYWDGIDPSTTITTKAAALDSVQVEFTPGEVYQMNRQKFPSLDILSDGIILVGVDNSGSLANLQVVNDLSEITELRDGTALIDGDMVILDIYGNVNYSESDCKLFVYPSEKAHTDATFAENIARGSRFTPVPKSMRTVAFPIMRLLLKYETANGGTWTNVLNEPVYTWTEETITEIATPNYPSLYDNNADSYIGTITKSGALAIRVLFDDFNTEANYDYIYCRNGVSSDNVHEYHGNLGSFTSGEIDGDTFRIWFHSDGSVKRSGAGITEYSYKTLVASGAEYLDFR